MVNVSNWSAINWIHRNGRAKNIQKRLHNQATSRLNAFHPWKFKLSHLLQPTCALWLPVTQQRIISCDLLATFSELGQNSLQIPPAAPRSVSDKTQDASDEGRIWELGKHLTSILKNPLITRRDTGGATQKRRGDSMYRKSGGMILLALVAIATVAGIMTQTYAASNNNIVPSSSTTLSTLSVSSTENNSSCRFPPPRMGNETGAPHMPPWMANLTTEQKRTLNETVTNMKTSGATQEQIMNAVDALLKQWGIQVPTHNGPPPTQPPNNSTTNTSRPPPPTITNSTDTTHPPPPWMTNQTDTQHPSPPWMANLTAQQKQTIDDTVTTMKATGATPEQIMNAVNELLKQWGIEIPQCP